MKALDKQTNNLQYKGCKIIFSALLCSYTNRISKSTKKKKEEKESWKQNIISDRAQSVPELQLFL